MIIKLIVVLLSLSIVLVAEDGEDDILKILNQASKYKTPKFPEYKIYDPFQRATPALKKAKEVKIKPTPPVPELKAVINSSAYIDGKWRSEGDYINGYRVAKIYDEYVILQFGDMNITLTVMGKSAKSKIEIIGGKR